MTTAPKTVREFSVAGPCLERGELIRETAKFYVYRNTWNTGGERSEVKKLMKRTPERYSRAHVEPCPSCCDHPRTQYPNGYMD